MLYFTTYSAGSQVWGNLPEQNGPDVGFDLGQLQPRKSEFKLTVFWRIPWARGPELLAWVLGFPHTACFDSSSYDYFSTLWKIVFIFVPGFH